jgi:hypothetical protein
MPSVAVRAISDIAAIFLKIPIGTLLTLPFLEKNTFTGTQRTISWITNVARCQLLVSNEQRVLFGKEYIYQHSEGDVMDYECCEGTTACVQ